MKHEFKDELRIKVDHNHEIATEDLDHLIDKVVDGVVTIIVVATAAHIFRKWVAS